MKKLDTYIIEKLKISKDLRIENKYDATKFKEKDILCSTTKNEPQFYRINKKIDDETFEVSLLYDKTEYKINNGKREEYKFPILNTVNCWWTTKQGINDDNELIIYNYKTHLWDGNPVIVGKHEED